MTAPPLLPFREKAERHVAKTKVLLQGGADEQIYGCLELRFAIEALAYDALQNYTDDRGTDLDAAHKEWHPKAVLKHLLIHDPYADRPLRIVMRLSSVRDDGTASDPIEFEEIEDRLDIYWATKAHAALSSFLHQPTITRVAKGGGVDHRTLQRKANEVISRLDSILASKISHARLEFRFGYACPACGEDISVAILPMMMGKAKTSCRACDAEWDVESVEGSDAPRFVRRTVGS